VLRIHTADGRTHAVDLSDPDQARAWLTRAKGAAFQATVRGVTLVEKHPARGACPECQQRCSFPLGVQLSISRPQEFRSVQLVAERVEASGSIKGGERATLYCDDVRLQVMAHAEQPAVRITLSKIGRRSFDPSDRNRENDPGEIG
jgi:hypothetical protein